MNKRKGFTLIELLAVIVILGLLMAIAIPSVTKYITQSRKKTVTSTIGNYIGSLVNDVNDLSYTFTEANTVYAVPIECIALERGGTNPFGAWHQANNAYWAYVLVQYDDVNSSYTYGYTFKDSAGYGLYPTSQLKLNEQGKQISTGLELSRPQTGKVTTITATTNWSGFKVDDSTDLVVLIAESEGNVGDGKYTCTLQQKGDNYSIAEAENVKLKADLFKDYTLLRAYSGSANAFWKYKSKIKNVIFQNNIDIPDSVASNMKWDVSVSQKGKVMAYVTPSLEDSSFYDLYIQGDGVLYANTNSSYLFSEFNNLDNIENINILNTKYVTDMSWMFNKTGYNSRIFTLDLGENFDTSNVTNMEFMFYYTGNNSVLFNLDLGDKFDTSRVTNMQYMFYYVGYNNSSFMLDLGKKFDTSNVINMKFMFCRTGYISKGFKLDCSDWNVDKVTEYTGFAAGVQSKVTAPQWKN